MTAPLMPVPLSALDLTFVGQYAEVEVIGCNVVRGGISDVKHVREHSGCSTRLYVGGHQLHLYDELTTLQVAAPVDPCDHTPLLEGPADAPSEAPEHGAVPAPAPPRGTPAPRPPAEGTGHAEPSVEPSTTGTRSDPRPRTVARRVLRWSSPVLTHPLTGPFIAASVSLVLMVLGMYLAIDAPRLSGGTFFGLGLALLGGIAVIRLVDVAWYRHEVNR